MADRWTLRTPTGDLQLNETFAAPTYQPGGVDTNAQFRREGRTAFQRAGDGLRTPGPLRLVGRVWRDDRDTRAMLTELATIREAIKSCTSVHRVTSQGTYEYSDLAGGAPPEVTPDGRGGWLVNISLWPGRAQPTFLPAWPAEPRFVAINHHAPILHWGTGSVTIPTEAREGDLLILRVAASRVALPGGAIVVNEDGWTRFAGDVTLSGNTAVLWWRRASDSDAGQSVTFTLGGGSTTAYYAASMSVYRGGDDQPIQAAAITTSDNGTAPSVSANAVPTLLLCFWDLKVSGALSAAPLEPPEGMTTRLAAMSPDAYPSGSKFTTLVAEERVTIGGPTGVRVATDASGVGGLWVPRASILLAPLPA